MGFMKKKAKKKADSEPLASIEVVMHNTTQVSADEKGNYCHALFQTEQAISPADWEVLAQHAREGNNFLISVVPGDHDGESKDND